MNIVICDDDKEIYDRVRECCTKRMEEPVVFYAFDSGEDLLEQLPQIGEVALFILDIEMPRMDGIALRNQLERRYPQCSIIFLTSHDELMQDAFGRCVIGFVWKNRLEMDLSEKLAQFYWEWKENTEFYIEEKNLKIRKNDIVSIRGERVYSVVAVVCGKTEQGEIMTEEVSIRRTLNAWEEMLGKDDFFRIHKSCIINFSYVKQFGKEVLLYDGSVYKISRSYSKSVSEAYRNYCRKMARCL